MSEWQPIETVPDDRYVLLFSPEAPRWAGNMEVGRLFGRGTEFACFWTCGGPNGGMELDEGSGYSHHQCKFTHWMDLPADVVDDQTGGDDE